MKRKNGEITNYISINEEKKNNGFSKLISNKKNKFSNLFLSFHNLLAQKTVNSLRPKNYDQYTTCYTSCVTIQFDSTIEQALHTLKQHNISSAPIIKDNQFYAFIEVKHIVWYILENSNDQESYANVQDEILKYNVGFAVKAHTSSHYIYQEFSLFSAYEKICRNTDINELAVINYQHNVLNILTKSMILQFLFQNINILSNDVLNAFITQLELSSVFQIIHHSKTIFEAFQLIGNNHLIHPLAVVDDKQQLTAVLSSRDFACYFLLKGVSKDIHQKQIKNLGLRKVITVNQKTTFADLLHLFIQEKIHQVFVINEQNMPINIITIDDILKFSLPYTSLLN